jgi:hypothetical protein
MELTKKKLCCLSFGAMILMAMLIFLPSTVFGATGTLGTEEPYIYCTYTDSSGSEVNGDALTAGTYQMDVVLSDVSSASVVQVTATYTSDVTVDENPVALLDSSVTDMKSMGCIIGDGNLVFGFVSENDDCSAIDGDVVIASLAVTFANDCDAEDVISVSDNPNLTFILADYGDGYDDTYAIDTAYEGYNGTMYPMSCDVSPSAGHTVSGEIVIMNSKDSLTSSGVPAYGTFSIDLYTDSARSNRYGATFESVYQSLGDGAKNVFELENLIPGTYYATITSEYSIARDITIIVSDSDITDVQIPMIVCDFDKDNYITADDAKFTYVAAGVGTLKEYCDLDGDGYATSDDAKVVYSLSAGSSYSSLTIS